MAHSTPTSNVPFDLTPSIAADSNASLDQGIAPTVVATTTLHDPAQLQAQVVAAKATAPVATTAPPAPAAAKGSAWEEPGGFDARGLRLVLASSKRAAGPKGIPRKTVQPSICALAQVGDKTTKSSRRLAPRSAENLSHKGMTTHLSTLSFIPVASIVPWEIWATTVAEDSRA